MDPRTSLVPADRTGRPLTPSELSAYLRTGDDADLRRRRALVALSLVGVGIGQVVGAYQVGLVTHLADPPVGPFHSDRVDASDHAYRRLSTPDGLAMVVTYAVTALLAGAGGPDRPTRQPLLPVLLAAKTASDLATNLLLAREEWAENRALCAWCQAATVASAVSLVVALPEGRRAWRTLRRR